VAARTQGDGRRRLIRSQFAAQKRLSVADVGDGESPHRSAIISVCGQGTSMEAERLNQIAASLADLKARTDELRRYL
jgi:hypothetical protein